MGSAPKGPLYWEYQWPCGEREETEPVTKGMRFVFLSVVAGNWTFVWESFSDHGAGIGPGMSLRFCHTCSFLAVSGNLFNFYENPKPPFLANKFEKIFGFCAGRKK